MQIDFDTSILALRRRLGIAGSPFVFVRGDLREKLRRRLNSTLKRMFRTTVVCTGLSETEASEAVADMLSEFAVRPWQQDVKCEWREGVLRLSAQNEVDSTGLALLDEFQDAVIAYISFESEIHFDIESVVQL